MAKQKQRRPVPPPEPPKVDIDSFPNDDLEDQLAADIQAITGVEQELSQLVGPENHAARWLRMLGRVLPNNAQCAKSHRVDPLPNMRAERIQQCRQDTLRHSRAHAEEAKATLEWYKENLNERRDQLPPWLKTRGEALAELQVLLWRSSPEGRLATMNAGLEQLRAVVERVEGKGSPDAAGLRERYNGCVRMAGLTRGRKTGLGVRWRRSKPGRPRRSKPCAGSRLPPERGRTYPYRNLPPHHHSRAGGVWCR